MVHNDEDKAWATLSTTINLGDFENIKIEVGYSKTVGTGKKHLDVVKQIEDDLEDLLVSKIEQIKGSSSKKRKKKRRKSKYDDIDATESDIY
jgi:hypothetical protein